MEHESTQQMPSGQETSRTLSRRAKWLIALGAMLILAAAVFFLTRPAVNSERLKNLPLVLQGDYTETLAVIGGSNKSVRSSGCGATCLSMAVSYLTGNAGQTPETLFSWACDNGYYYGEGLGHDCLDAMAKLYGLKTEWLVKDDADRALEALQKGYPVIAHMGSGTFTQNGHYILLRGVDEEGKILVNDPASEKRSGEAYDFSLILTQLKTNPGLMIVTR